MKRYGNGVKRITIIYSILLLLSLRLLSAENLYEDLITYMDQQDQLLQELNQDLTNQRAEYLSLKQQMQNLENSLNQQDQEIVNSRERSENSLQLSIGNSEILKTLDQRLNQQNDRYSELQIMVTKASERSLNLEQSLKDYERQLKITNQSLSVSRYLISGAVGAILMDLVFGEVLSSVWTYTMGILAGSIVNSLLQ